VLSSVSRTLVPWAISSRCTQRPTPHRADRRCERPAPRTRQRRDTPVGRLVAKFIESEVRKSAANLSKLR
jgi:hypothetical protein